MDNDSFTNIDRYIKDDHTGYLLPPDELDIFLREQLPWDLEEVSGDEVRVGNSVGNDAGATQNDADDILQLFPITDIDQSGTTNCQSGEGCDEDLSKVVTKTVGDAAYRHGNGTVFEPEFISKNVHDTTNAHNATAREQQEKTVPEQKSTLTCALLQHPSSRGKRKKKSVGKTDSHKGARKQKVKAGIRAPNVPWTPNADKILNFLVEQSGVTIFIPWTDIARELNEQTGGYFIEKNNVRHKFTPDNCKKRWGDRSKTEKRTPHKKWTAPEDQKLRELVREHGYTWKTISEKMNASGFVRGDAQCRYRFVKKLKTL